MPDLEAPPPAPSSTSRRTDLLLVALAVAALGGGAAIWWFRRAPPPLPAAPPPVAEVAPAPAVEPPPAPVAPLPKGEREALLDAVTGHAGLRGLLAGEDLPERLAALLANVGAGTSARKFLEPLAPSKPFAVVEREGKHYMAPAAAHRFDGVTGAIAAVEPGAVKAAWTALHPALDAAWRALGEPDASVDKAAARALSRLEAAPVVEGDLEVVPASDAKGAPWLLADPKLEALPAVEKQLLRTGPKNARALKAKAAALRKALGLPYLPPAGR